MSNDNQPQAPKLGPMFLDHGYHGTSTTGGIKEQHPPVGFNAGNILPVQALKM